MDHSQRQAGIVLKALSLLGSTVSEMGEAEKCPNPRKPISGNPTAKIGGWEMVVNGSLTLPRCSFDAHVKDMGGYKRHLTPMSVQNLKKAAKFG